MSQALAPVRLAAALLGLAALAGGLARADDAPGRFDHYVLALSWNAGWCVAEGDRRGAAQCDPREDFDFILHGLWPQQGADWPEYCRTGARDPSRRDTARMADIMGSPGLAWHQWKKHGRCSGLSADAYFDLSRRAFRMIARPPTLGALREPVRIDPKVIEAAFLEANPALRPDGVTVTCRDGRFREVRICLDRDLVPRDCVGRAARDCGAGAITLDPAR